MSTAVVLFTRDLRVHDHPALAAAARRPSASCRSSCSTTRLLAGRCGAPNRLAFLLDSAARPRRARCASAARGSSSAAATSSRGDAAGRARPAPRRSSRQRRRQRLRAARERAPAAGLRRASGSRFAPSPGVTVVAARRADARRAATTTASSRPTGGPGASAAPASRCAAPRQLTLPRGLAAGTAPGARRR